MKYSIKLSKSFKKQYKKLSNKDKEAFKDVAKKLADGQALEPKHRDHALLGDYLGYRECHIRPDLLLVYRIYDDILELYLANLGSYGELDF